VRKIKLFINGKWREGAGGRTLDVINPATEETIATLCVAEQEDLEDALQAASLGFKVWKNTPASKKAKILHKTADLMRERIDEIARVNTTEQGKPIGQSKFEINVTANYFDDLAECGLQITQKDFDEEAMGVSRSIRYEPIGPVYAVSPWNLPAMMPGRKIATALAAGCSVISKPAEETPETAMLIAQCCQDAGLPDGVLNMVCGDPEMISNTLITSPVIRKISFTGSTAVGKMLTELAGKHMKKVTMELGGHAPVIICDDVDVDGVVDTTVPARYANAGQSCMAATRFFVSDGVYGDFITKFTGKVEKLKLGEGTEEDVDVGPMANKRRLSALEELVEDAVAKGAEILCGGSRLTRRGYYFAPTVLGNVPDDARIMKEEPFGPITPITRFSNIEEVIERANSTPYGLASYVFSKDKKLADKIANALEVGLVGVNSMNVAGPAVPFGGVKDSGIGREGAIEGILECMTIKAVTSKLT